ncbi:BlaI/MecI/CopY family transcriptional regulator [Oleiagrimonas sp. MCCC 1A03011]|uniref:BlaI/MecI/CopY family transcriptional regulator n=1 Tax=Oleiagrimonas sp. MCCC 1A03011 TaxID=1926883 RepID=UPI000DC372BD|nr:BlaI/MecI/CopY family transcriptional regulator [Oleiagrimonas sp. MCCC 1A03011]RAP56458.1 BlaI/MecI/CopY family transcriptional regulator [Oleiagrimonas sp. MCCC 1A03011]
MAISEAESRVMDVLWSRSPLSADDVVAALADHTDWHDKTIRTLLNRLLRKGALTHERDGRRYLYKPAVRREEYVSQESRSLIDRLFGGRVAPMLAHFREHEALSEDDIAALRRLLDDIDREEGDA